MTDYKDGKEYRRALDNSPPKSSTPDPGERHLSPYPQEFHFPVSHHAKSAPDHKETVGWLNGTFHEPTHPNSHSMAHGASGSHETNRAHEPGALDAEPQRRGKATGFNR